MQGDKRKPGAGRVGLSETERGRDKRWRKSWHKVGWCRLKVQLQRGGRLASSKLVQLARPCQVPPDRQGAGVSLGESQYGAGTLADGLLQASAGVPLRSCKPSWFVAGGEIGATESSPAIISPRQQMTPVMMQWVEWW